MRAAGGVPAGARVVGRRRGGDRRGAGIYASGAARGRAPRPRAGQGCAFWGLATPLPPLHARHPPAPPTTRTAPPPRPSRQHAELKSVVFGPRGRRARPPRPLPGPVAAPAASARRGGAGQAAAAAARAPAAAGARRGAAAVGRGPAVAAAARRRRRAAARGRGRAAHGQRRRPPRARHDRHAAGARAAGAGQGWGLPCLPRPPAGRAGPGSWAISCDSRRRWDALGAQWLQLQLLPPAGPRRCNAPTQRAWLPGGAARSRRGVGGSTLLLRPRPRAARRRPWAPAALTTPPSLPRTSPPRALSLAQLLFGFGANILQVRSARRQRHAAAARRLPSPAEQRPTRPPKHPSPYPHTPSLPGSVGPVHGRDHGGAALLPAHRV
jgi:hypothetical protein